MATRAIAAIVVLLIMTDLPVCKAVESSTKREMNRCADYFNRKMLTFSAFELTDAKLSLVTRVTLKALGNNSSYRARPASGGQVAHQDEARRDRDEYRQAAEAFAEDLNRVSGTAILTRPRSPCSRGGGDHKHGKARAPHAACLATSPNRKSTRPPQSATSSSRRLRVSLLNVTRRPGQSLAQHISSAMQRELGHSTNRG
jgi:hypothetical protein